MQTPSLSSGSSDSTSTTSSSPGRSTSPPKYTSTFVIVDPNSSELPTANASVPSYHLTRSPTYTSIHHHSVKNNQNKNNGSTSPNRSSLAYTPASTQSGSINCNETSRGIAFPTLPAPTLSTGGAVGGNIRKTRQSFNSNGDRDSLSPNLGTSGAAIDQLEAKVVILGSQGVGKTSIIHRYTSGHFSNSLSSTIGASFLTKKLVVDGCKVRIQLWDTAGQERFRSMAPLYYRGALAAILVYDITNADSFSDVRIWLEELRKNMSPDLIIHVVGSKADLAQTHSVVDLETARETIADWVDNSSDSATTSRSPSPPSSRNTNTLESVRPRTRTLSTQRLPTLGSVPSPRNRLPIITAPPTTAPPSFNPRTRTRLSSQISNNTPSIASNSSTLTSTTATPSVSSSFLFSDHIASSASEMTRSGSNFSIALSGLGLGGGNIGGGRSRRGTDEGRKGFEDLERIKEEKRQERIRACGITVTEVSAKDDIGIEELFLNITQQLVERKVAIENARVLRSRDSIMLTEADVPAISASSWCCL